MLIVMKRGYTEEELREVVREIEKVGYRPHVSQGVETTLVGAIGRGPTPELMEHFRALPGVAEVIPISKPWKLASLEVQPFPTVLDFPTGRTGGDHVMVAAGPCGVESHEQTLRAARYVKAHGAHMLRGGAFKPRTSPYAFQGLGVEGLKILAEARRRPVFPWSPRSSPRTRWSSWPSTPTSSRSGPETLRTFPSSRRWGKRASPSSSSGG